MYELKTNTAVRIAVGPLVDPTDGKTAETSLTVTGMVVDIIQMDNDGTAVNRTSFSPTASGGNNDMIAVPSSTVGMYDLELTAAQLNFLGNARLVFYDVDGFLVHWIDLQVVSAAYFNWKYGSTIPDVNVTQISGDSTAADNCELMFDGTGYAGGTTKLGVDAVAISGDSTAADNLEKAVDGTGLTFTNCVMPTTTTVTNEVTADVTKISGDATAANNCESFFDGTGYAGTNNVIPTVTAVSNGVTLADDAITAAKFDESTAFPLKSADTGATAVARTGADSDTLETLSDHLDDIEGKIDDTFDDVGAVQATVDLILADTGTTLDGKIDSILEDTGTTLPATLVTILADTNELQTDWADGGRLDLLLDGCQVAGAGAYECTVTVSDDEANPLANVRVWVASDAAGETILASGTTDSSGEVTFYLDSGTVYIFAYKPGYNVTNPTTDTVSDSGLATGTVEMTAAESASSLAICNDALYLLGNNAITSLDDNTKAAKLCSQFYQKTVDSVLRAYTWNCAICRSDDLTETDTPEFGYSYAFTLPDDCLRVLSIEDEPTIPFRIEAGCILTDESTCKIMYIKRVTPDEMDSLLLEAIAARLAAVIAFPLTNSTSAAEAMWKLYEVKLDEAQSVDAFEGTPPQVASDDWINARS